MIKTTVGQFLVNEALPAPMRDYNRVYDQKGLDSVLDTLAREYPDKYREVTKKLSDIGGEVAYRQGGLTFGAEHLLRPAGADSLAKSINQKAQKIYLDPSLTPAKRKKAIIDLVRSSQDQMTEASYGQALKDKNPLAIQAAMGFRGNKSSISGMLGAPMLYNDYKGDEIAFPITRSFSQGLSPMQFLASTYGGRKGVLATKMAVAEAGALNKQITQAAHQVMVDRDDEEGDWHKGTTPRGLPVATKDNANIGALLAHDTAGYKKNTVLTPKILRDLQEKGADQILVRSPLVGGTETGGVHARDLGIRNKRGLSPAGTFVGIETGQGVGEPLTQLTLCLAEGTLVRMADWSVKPIEEIKAGDLVMGSDSFGNVSPTRVVNTYDNGLKECVTTRFRVGLTQEMISLTSTLDHKVLGITRYWGRKKTKVVEGVQPVGKKCLKFAALMPAAITNSYGRQEPFALLLGLLLGDGCYTRSVNSVHLSCYDPLLIDDIQGKLFTIGLRASKLKHHKGYYQIAQLQDVERARDPVSGRLIGMGGAVNPIKKELISRGMYGKYAHEKTIPEDVWQWDQSSVAELIAGYFATDGSVYGVTDSSGKLGVYVDFGSTSLQMLNTLRQLLSVRFGIFASPPKESPAGKNGRKRSLWSVAISRKKEVKRFFESIPLYGVKRRTFENLLRQKADFDGKDWSWFFRHSQVPAGLVPTYDIEVDNQDHLFQLANGLIVSNSTKHSGGVAGASKVGGFQLIESLANPPKNMPYGAAHAQTDGRVDRITENPAGGKDVWVNNQKHYVPSQMPLKVKPGDEVEAGDVLSEGVPNPRDIVAHKGIGEGRRYLMRTLYDAYRENRVGAKALRRNLEPVVRGLVDHVVMTDFWNQHAPEDIVRYSHIEHNWTPRQGYMNKSPRQAVGKYLEAPVLHHTIGTQVKSSMVPEMERFGVGQVMVHDEPPPFKPNLLRATDNLRHDPDWQVRLGGQYLERGLLDAAHRGLASSTTGTSFIPPLIRGDDLSSSLNKQPKPFGK